MDVREIPCPVNLMCMTFSPCVLYFREALRAYHCTMQVNRANTLGRAADKIVSCRCRDVTTYLLSPLIRVHPLIWAVGRITTQPRQRHQR